ncbi:putative ankyrin repeat protein [Acanthamoeba polyphaga mimivirus]|uniref:Putative ankyrin repeat protein n=1 Tax=Acanthamoeba polyphaga mimivirus TaxID=212035 RepID=A0A0G2XZM9_MIMIV|nr:putative ankyrin repeat protein [Acanthamoeba polyphaga mimivirus]
MHNAVDYFVSKNININAVNEFGKTPLITAIKSGNCIMVEKLINCGADFNKHEIYKLAFDHRHDDIFVLLVDKKIESDKFYSKIKDEFGKINVNRLTDSKLDSILNVLDITIIYPNSKSIRPRLNIKDLYSVLNILNNTIIYQNFNIKNLIKELKMEKDNFSEMLEKLSTKKNNDKFYDCTNEIISMISLKMVVCELLYEEISNNIKFYFNHMK